jgi:hypothetical protein
MNRPTIRAFLACWCVASILNIPALAAAPKPQDLVTADWIDQDRSFKSPAAAATTESSLAHTRQVLNRTEQLIRRLSSAAARGR